MRKMKKNRNGFTVAELLIVVAIIAVLVAIAIPIFTAQLHKTRVATDWANLRAYYAELQVDYMTTEKQNPSVPVDWHSNPAYDWTSITLLTGEKISMETGKCAVSFNKDSGYSISYVCDKGHTECNLKLGK